MDEIVAQTGNNELEFLALDLGDLASVRACASEFLQTGKPLHGLINNAGLAGQRGLTASGFELAFGTNYVGPFLLTGLLLDRLRESVPARIVNVSSIGHYRAAGIDYEAVRQPMKSRTGLPEYSVSKLGNVLHAQELARRLKGDRITTYSLHPGAIATDVWRRVPCAPADQATDAIARGGGKDIAVLCDLARSRGRERSLLRRLPPQEAEPDRDAATCRGALAPQHRLGRPTGVSRAVSGATTRDDSRHRL
jgi:NAD(P)-dependent dehydrogenase (short-subunit alcohol dehydrogenase family)